MGNLPSFRISPSRPFQHSGIDYAGPILIKMGKGRSYKSAKGYMCIFVCMVTRAVHLEAVMDYTTDSFIAALIRFVSRRGLPSDLYSDNDPNFQGADKLLKKTWKNVLIDNDVQSHTSQHGIK